ncbi:MAG TPA: ATP-grasp domain-containing protein [Thermoleophilia bacterium]
MTLPPLKLVLTASGCPGAATLIRMLKANGEREIHIVGVDTRADAAGRFLCDDFATVPPGASDDYVPALAAVVARERPDVLVVQSSAEVGPVARSRATFADLGARVLVAAPEAVALSSDKAAMYATLQGTTVPQPESVVPASLDEFVAAARDLGYPDAPVCFKPPVAKGSRGFHVLQPRVDAAHQLLAERGGNLPLTLDDFVAAFRDVRPFPRLLLMEFVEGPEFTVDALVGDGEVILHQTKTREEISTGLAMAFKTVDRPDLVRISAEICRATGLDWFVNVQFKGDKLLEVNPRVSTFVYQEDFNLPYLGIKYALGELDREAVAFAQAAVRPSRRTVRYYDQLFWDA